MNGKSNSIIGIFVTAGVVGLLLMLPEAGMPGPAKPSFADYLNALPASGAGLPAQAARSAEAYLGGSKATGRVAEVYVRAAENVFLAANRAPEPLRQSGERWVDIEFPEALGEDVESVRAVLNPSEAGVQVGDVVEVKFAHKDNPRYFPVKELTRVTELVARKGEMLARDYERRILARNTRSAAPLWTAAAPVSPAAALASAQPLR